MLKKLARVNPLTIRKRGTRAKALAALALVCFLWGTTWLASKAGVKHMPAFQMAGIRQLIGGSVYLAYFSFKGRAFPKGREWGPVLVLSFLNIFLSNGLSTWGVQYISSGLGAIIAAMVPLWLVVIALFGGTSNFNARSVIGFILGFAGICIIFYDHLQDFLNTDFRFGIILSIGASLSWAFGTLYTKKQALAFNPYFSIGLQMVISGIAMTGVALLTGKHIPISQIPIISWLSIAYLAIFGSVFAFMAYLYALQNLPTEQASIYAYINPIVAILLGSLIFDEKLNSFIIIGGIVAIAGVYLVNESFKGTTIQSESQ
ncbi:DMT family transporter [Flavihumibacter profundi]|uniref:DMT family transporter n=1 Tax=Flavihumibacter profundi TaxID=2716883 RepID=UPI001CC36A75|nr:EamA family transporter [Flavihumibacter profundi]MBZ5858643.1 EamA family transporter [Flavihumibacter profundi]